MEYIYVTGFSIIIVLIVYNLLINKTFVNEYERGLKYKEGRFTEELGPGAHRYLPFGITIQKIDIRPRVVSISGQEVLTSDGVSVKLSIAATYEVADAYTALNKVENYKEALYLNLQLVLREIVGKVDIETLLENRDSLFNEMSEKCQKLATTFGLNLIAVNVKDIMFPGALKEMFAQVAKAKREAQAALERARGETASLRNLANAAKMLETNPNLMKLRLLQTINESSGNTFIINAANPSEVIPLKE